MPAIFQRNHQPDWQTSAGWPEPRPPLLESKSSARSGGLRSDEPSTPSPSLRVSPLLTPPVLQTAHSARRVRKFLVWSKKGERIRPAEAASRPLRGESGWNRFGRRQRHSRPPVDSALQATLEQAIEWAGPRLESTSRAAYPLRTRIILPEAGPDSRLDPGGRLPRMVWLQNPLNLCFVADQGFF